MYTCTSTLSVVVCFVATTFKTSLTCLIRLLLLLVKTKFIVVKYFYYLKKKINACFEMVWIGGGRETFPLGGGEAYLQNNIMFVTVAKWYGC